MALDLRPWLVFGAALVGTLSSAVSPQLAVPATRQASHIAILPIHGPIDDVTVKSVERRAQAAAQSGATAIVLELNTPGGDMYATLQLCHLIKTTLPANTVAWVRPQAYSAGVILALACREVVMAKGAAMGDAAPIQVIPGMGLAPLPATERAKLEAPIISEVVDSARGRGYDENLVQAFVRLGTELWLIRNQTTMRRAIVDREEYRALFGEDPPTQAAAAIPDSALLSETEALVPWIGGLGEREVLESPLGTPAPRRRIDPASRADWTLVGQVAKGDQLLVVRTEDAAALGLSRATIAGEPELATWFGATRVDRYPESWSEAAVRFLTSWPVRIVLIIFFIVGIVIEALTPGGVLFGAIATVALLLLVGAPALVGLAEWWEFVAILLGLALVALDIVILPLGGWVAILGGALVLAALISSFVTRDISSAEGQRQLLLGISSTLAGLFGSVALIWALWKHLPDSRIAKVAMLHAAASPGTGARATADPSGPAVGTIVTAATDLRPSGKITVAGKPWDAQTGGEYVSAGSPVRIVRSTHSLIVVEPAAHLGGDTVTPPREAT